MDGPAATPLSPPRPLCIQLDALLDAVGLAAVDLLAGLGDGLQDLLVAEFRAGNNDGGLVLEADLVALDAYVPTVSSVSH